MTIRMTAGMLWLASATAVVLAQSEGGAPGQGGAAAQPAVVRAALVYPSAFPVRNARPSCRP